MQSRAPVFTVAMSAIFLSACGGLNEDQPEDATVAQSAVNQTFAQHQAACQADPRVQSGQVSLTECIGADIFMKENFNGNGRTCGTCHRVERNFAIDAPFIARLPNSDPLFIAENQSDSLPLNGLEIPAQLRARALILENVDGTQPEGPTVRFVLRSVPHNLSQGTSVTRPSFEPNPPAESTGWSGDGAPSSGTNASGVPMTGRLADFTNGAINQHFTRSLNRVIGTDFRQATEPEGQAVATFMRALGRTNEISLTGITFSDPDADAGRVKFVNSLCNTCHSNAGANDAGSNQNFLTGVEGARNPALAGFPFDGGFGAVGGAPPFAIGNASFNTPPVIEAADSGPFFHTDTQVIASNDPAQDTDSAQTIEQAVAFYNSQQFQLGFTATEIRNVARFLRALNAVFNIQMASNRIIGARNMGNVLGNVARVDRMQRRLAQMTLFELDDAVRVLSQGVSNLNPLQADRVRTARTRIETVANTAGTTATAFNIRMTNLANAFNDLDLADSEISANITFNIGNATRMDCADPSSNTQPGTAPCFNPALRTPAP
jgi:cytochrome c peroxidase